MKHYNIPIFVPHQGCPHDCVFCNQRQITGQSALLKTADIQDQINHFLQSLEKHHGPRTVEIAFFGGSFTGIAVDQQEALLSLAYDYKSSGLIDGIRLSTRPDYIDAAILKRLKKYGVTTIELGVQSMDPRVIDLSRRGHTVTAVKAAVNAIRQFDFKLGLQMMIGLPGDRGSYEKTMTSLISLGPDFVRIYPTLVIQGTELERLYQSGHYKPLDLNEAVIICAGLLRGFEKAGIPVIRLGLQASDELNSEVVVAGPYHPAFKQLVESRRWLDVLLQGLKTYKGDLLIQANSRDISDIAGQKRCNLKVLEAHLGMARIKVMPVDCPRGTAQLTIENKTLFIRK